MASLQTRNPTSTGWGAHGEGRTGRELGLGEVRLPLFLPILTLVHRTPIARL